MRDEQLQMILTALQSLGAESKDAFIWWLVLDKGLPVLGWLMAFSGLLWLALKVISAVSAASHMAKLRDEMGIGCPGPLWDSEATAVAKKVREMLRKQQAG